MSWFIIWAYIIGSLVYHGQLSNVTWMALMIFDGAGIIRLTHDDGRAVLFVDRLITLRDVLMSWTIYVTLKYTTIIPDIVFGWLPLYSTVRWTFFSLFITTRTTSARPIFITFIKPLFSKYETQIDLFLELVSATTALITYYTHRYPIECWDSCWLGFTAELRELKYEGVPRIYIFALPFTRWLARRRIARQLAAKAKVIAAARMAASSACSRIIEAQRRAQEAHRIAALPPPKPGSWWEFVQQVQEEYANLVEGPTIGRHPIEIWGVCKMGTPLEEAMRLIDLAQTLPIPPKLRFDSAPTGVAPGDLSRLPASPTPARQSSTASTLPPDADDGDRARSRGAPSPDSLARSEYRMLPGAWPQENPHIDVRFAHHKLTHDISHDEIHEGDEQKADIGTTSRRASRGAKRAALETPEGHRDKYARTLESCPGAPRKHNPKATHGSYGYAASTERLGERLEEGRRSGEAVRVERRRRRAEEQSSSEEGGRDEVFFAPDGEEEAAPRVKRTRRVRWSIDEGDVMEAGEAGSGSNARVAERESARRTTTTSRRTDQPSQAAESSRRGGLARSRVDARRSTTARGRTDENDRDARSDSATRGSVSDRGSVSNGGRAATYNSARGTSSGFGHRPVITSVDAPRGSNRIDPAHRPSTRPISTASTAPRLVPVGRAHTSAPYDINRRPTRLGSATLDAQNVTKIEPRRRVPLEPKPRRPWQEEVPVESLMNMGHGRRW